MWGYAILAMLAIGLGTIAAHDTITENTNTVQSAAAAMAGNALVYRNAVVLYAAVNPTTTGTVADSSLDLPAWYRRMVELNHYMSGGNGYVYVSGISGSVAYNLVKAMGNSINAGIKIGGNLVNPLNATNYLIPIALPSAIPDGSVVIIP